MWPCPHPVARQACDVGLRLSAHICSRCLAFNRTAYRTHIRVTTVVIHLFSHELPQHLGAEMVWSLSSSASSRSGSEARECCSQAAPLSAGGWSPVCQSSPSQSQGGSDEEASSARGGGVVPGEAASDSVGDAARAHVDVAKAVAPSQDTVRHVPPTDRQADTKARSRSRSSRGRSSSEASPSRVDSKFPIPRKLTPPPDVPGCSWWSTPLWHALAQFMVQRPEVTTRRVSVESMCCGLASEFWAFKAPHAPFASRSSAHQQMQRSGHVLMTLCRMSFCSTQYPRCRMGAEGRQRLELHSASMAQHDGSTLPVDWFRFFAPPLEAWICVAFATLAHQYARFRSAWALTSTSSQSASGSRSPRAMSRRMWRQITCSVRPRTTPLGLGIAKSTTELAESNGHPTSRLPGCHATHSHG